MWALAAGASIHSRQLPWSGARSVFEPGMSPQLVTCLA